MPKKVHDDPAQTLLSFSAPTITPRGDGSFVVTPGKPIEKLTTTQAAARLGLSVWSIYQLINAGLLAAERPSPRKILIPASSVEEHLRHCSDPEYWEQPKRRDAYLRAYRATPPSARKI